MISVVLYGRNDNYGYNLHKRAALSINCIAETLEDGTDEIIFVDYNTPDDFPTFPEAIQDTLTGWAKRRLRVLRVRPRLHERYRSKTHLVALEPIARNIALRRSNPRNKWILSTNTDIILLPRSRSSLSRIAESLPKGFYHTPRFEIPESCWELFDRLEPKQTLRDIRKLAQIAHLNEIVYAAPVILFDGPGDFQLAERHDLFEIDGFDEEMILGWHVDSNLARRLTLKHGAVSPLVDGVFCYHCDHTRQTTAAHKRERIENDPRRFVDSVSASDIPTQRHTWGCPEDPIEEIVLSTRSDRSLGAVIARTLPPAGQITTEAAYIPESYDNYFYRPAHVLPFLADMFICLPRDTRLGWFGSRRDLFDLTQKIWRRFGFTKPILIDRAGLDLRDGADSFAEPVDCEQIIAEAGILAFEFGLASHSGRDDVDWRRASPVRAADAEGLYAVRQSFLAAVEHERARLEAAPDREPRRFIGVNCIHNRMEGLFNRHIGINFTPFSSRLRHGFVVVPQAGVSDPVDGNAAAVGRLLGRPRAVGASEFAALGSLLSALDKVSEPQSDLDHRVAVNAAALLAVLRCEPAAAALVVAPESIARLMARIEKLRPGPPIQKGFSCLTIATARQADEPRSLSRFADYADWDDPAWLRFAEVFTPDPTPENGFLRGSWVWERAHILYALDKASLLGRHARVLVVATQPDALIGALSERVGTLAVLDIASHEPSALTSMRGFWADNAPYARDALRPLPIAARLQDLLADSFDAVVFPHNSLFSSGIQGAVDHLCAAERLVRMKGLLLFKAEIVSGPAWHPVFLNSALMRDDGLAAGFKTYTGLDSHGFDRRVHEATLDKAWGDAGAVSGETYFVWRDEGRDVMISVWALEKLEPTTRAGWNALHQRLMDAAPLDAKRVAGAGRGTGVIASQPVASPFGFTLPVLSEDGSQRSLSRMAESEDERDPIWKSFGKALIEPDRSEPSPDWLWERTHILFGLARLYAEPTGVRILAATTMPDRIVDVLKERFPDTETIAIVDDAGDRPLRHLPAGGFDVIVFPHNSLFCLGLSGVFTFLEAADRLLDQGGTIVFNADVLAGETPHPIFIDEGLTTAAGLSQWFASMTGYEVTGGFDQRVSEATLPRSEPDGGVARNLGFVHWRDRRAVMSSMWFLRKTNATSADAWAQCRDRVAERALGDQSAKLSVGVGGERREDGHIGTRPDLSGCIFYGPYIDLPPGGYVVEVAFSFTAVFSGRSKSLGLDVMDGDTIFGTKRLAPEVGTLRAGMRFQIAEQSSGMPRRIEFRGHTDGGLEGDLLECKISRIPDEEPAPSQWQRLTGLFASRSPKP